MLSIREVEGAAEAASFSGFQFTFLGTAGMFLAMITAILTVEIYAWAIRKKLVITTVSTLWMGLKMVLVTAGPLIPKNQNSVDKN